MSKAYLNALYEEGTRQEIFDWLVKKDAEVDRLKDEIKKNEPNCKPAPNDPS